MSTTRSTRATRKGFPPTRPPPPTAPLRRLSSEGLRRLPAEHRRRASGSRGCALTERRCSRFTVSSKLLYRRSSVTRTLPTTEIAVPAHFPVGRTAALPDRRIEVGRRPHTSRCLFYKQTTSRAGRQRTRQSPSIAAKDLSKSASAKVADGVRVRYSSCSFKPNRSHGAWEARVAAGPHAGRAIWWRLPPR